MADTFTCAHCGGTFEKGWTDEESLAEAKANLRAVPEPEDAALICDPCYEKFMRWYNSLTEAQHQEMESKNG